MEELELDKPGYNLSSIISMIKPALEAHTTPVRNKQKTLNLKYWGSFCAAYNVNIYTFGEISKEVGLDPTRRSQKAWEEVQCLAGFGSYVFLLPRIKTQTITAQHTRNVRSAYFEDIIKVEMEECQARITWSTMVIRHRIC